MAARWLFVALFTAACGPIGTAAAEEPTAREVAFHGYTKAIELKLGKTRAVLCPQAGGRVLEFSVDGTDAMYLDEAEKNWQPGKPGPITAGRFDYGPELTVTPHPKAWAGEWTAEITKTELREADEPPRGRRDSTGAGVPPRPARRVRGPVVQADDDQRLEGDPRGVPLGPVVLAGRRHLRDPARRPAEPVPEQVRDVRGRRRHQREGDGREDPRAGRVPRNPGPAAEAEARLRHLRRVARAT